MTNENHGKPRNASLLGKIIQTKLSCLEALVESLPDVTFQIAGSSRDVPKIALDDALFKR